MGLCQPSKDGLSAVARMYSCRLDGLKSIRSAPNGIIAWYRLSKLVELRAWFSQKPAATTIRTKTAIFFISGPARNLGAVRYARQIAASTAIARELSAGMTWGKTAGLS
jgi:hypothetical protein